MPTVAWYVSSHGFGHAVRAVEVMRCLPDDVTIVVKSAVPEWFFSNETGRAVRYLADSFDVGCRQADAATIDWDATFDAFAEMERRNATRVDEELRFLANERIDAIVSDVPPFPIEMASRAGIPALIVANFTWVDIYEPLANQYRQVGGIVERLRAQYAHADLLMRTALGLEMPYFPNIRDVPLPARRGIAMRETICARLGLDPKRPLYLIYVGQWGVDDMDWSALGELPDAQFITVTPPKRCPANLTPLAPSDFRHEDLTASVDAVVAKPGYGICGECIASSTPLLYCARPDFAEFPAMERDLRRWGGAIRIDQDDFFGFRLGPWLKRAASLSIDDEVFDVDGAEVCARIVDGYLRRGRTEPSSAPTAAD